jgi:hypothetical protein
MCRGTATGAIARLRSRLLFSAVQQWKLYTADRQQKRRLQQVAAGWHLDGCQRRAFTTWWQLAQVKFDEQPTSL